MAHYLVDCQGLAGAFTLGAVQAGLQLAHRVSEPGGFGDLVVLDNSRLLGTGWSIQESVPESWGALSGVGFVCGTPPCSAFSNMTAHLGDEGHGINAPINSCMKDLVEYGARCVGEDGRQGAEVISLESVQGAFKQGRPMMVELRDRLDRFTGQEYSVHHLLVSGSSLGAAQHRHRYYLVLARVPFGASFPSERHVETVRDAIGDLEGAKTVKDAQKYPKKPQSELQKQLRGTSEALLDHFSATTLLPGAKSRSDVSESEITDFKGRGWAPNEPLYEFFRRTGYFPGRFDEHHVRTRWVNAGPRLVDPDRPGNVITGGAARAFVHWSEPRYLTVREGARLMGYPDGWAWPTESVLQAWALVGKCAPVASCRWLSEKVVSALDGEPEELGRPIGEREFVYEFTDAYKTWLLRQGVEAPRKRPKAKSLQPRRRRRHPALRWVSDWFPSRKRRVEWCR